MRKVLVAGGGGYVGSVLVRELLERGYEVLVLDNLYYGDEGLRELSGKAEVIADDIRSCQPSVLQGVDAVVNLAGFSNDPTAAFNPRANYEINTAAAHHLASLCKQHGVPRYVYASSASLYDRGLHAKDADIVQDEESDVNPEPHYHYSRSKRDAERLLLPMADEDFCVTVLRKGTVHGFSPRMRYDLVVNTFVKDALSKGVLTLHHGGEMWRPVVDVHDAARAYIAVLEAPREKVSGQLFNVALQNVRVSELALRMREALYSVGVDVVIRPDYSSTTPGRCYRLSTEKIERVLDFRPQTSIEDTVVQLVKGIREYGFTDFDHARYYNIRWMEQQEAETLAERADDQGAVMSSRNAAARQRLA
jgi:nucleoside-diphosphate-sugar epimerase